MNNKRKFYEFNNHEYYGLVVADNEEKAYEVYFEGVGGSSVDEIKAEGSPDEITYLNAFAKTISADIKYGDEIALNSTIKDYQEAFDSYENTALLIDGSLV